MDRKNTQTEFETKLVKEFPNLYRNMRGDPRQTCMAWGIAVSAGWYDIIYGLSQKLETMIQNIPEDKRPEYMAAQVKEKFGGLRFYMEASTTEMDAFIKEAEETCWHTCETCGQPGKLVKAGWLYVSCKEHAKKEHQTQFEDT
jgi:hypothetical protein